MSEVPMHQPLSPVAPPSPPGPGGSRYEWRAYRHQMRVYMRSQRQMAGWYEPFGLGLFFAIALVLSGGYYLLRNLGALPSVNDGVLWSILLILLGLVLLMRVGAWRR